MSEQTSTSEQDFKKAQEDLERSEQEKAHPPGPPNPLALKIEQARRLIDEIRLVIENYSYPAVLAQAAETAQKLDGTLTAEAKHLAENNGLLQALLNSLEQLQKILADEIKAQAEQRAFEKVTLEKINRYLELWQ